MSSEAHGATWCGDSESSPRQAERRRWTGTLDSTRAGLVDWTKWHDRYDEQASLKERLAAVREQITAAISRATTAPVQVLSLYAGDGRDLIGSLAASRSRKAVNATLVESSTELVARGQNAAAHLHLTDEVTFRCADATLSSTYLGLPRAHLIVTAGVFGNLIEADVRRLVVSLQSLCRRHAYVVWTRNLVEFDDGEKAVRVIRESFLQAGFREERFIRTPGGVFAVGSHCFEGEMRP